MDSSGAQLSLANKSSICFLYTLLPALRVAGVTPTVNLEFQIHLTCILLVCGRKLDNHTHRKAPGPGSNPQPSCCEATVLTAAAPSHPANLSQPTWYVSFCSHDISGGISFHSTRLKSYSKVPLIKCLPVKQGTQLFLHHSKQRNKVTFLHPNLPVTIEIRSLRRVNQTCSFLSLSNNTITNTEL